MAVQLVLEQQSIMCQTPSTCTNTLNRNASFTSSVRSLAFTTLVSNTPRVNDTASHVRSVVQRVGPR